MTDPSLETALRDFEVTANSFALRINKSASIRKGYVQQIKEMSQSIRRAVNSGELSAKRGAELANEFRNQILMMQRKAISIGAKYC